MKKKIFICILISLSLGAIFYFISSSKGRSKLIKAQSAQATLSSQGDWILGANSNTDLNSITGSVKIDNKNTSQIDLHALYLEDTGRVTASINPSHAPCVVDNDPLSDQNFGFDTDTWNNSGGVDGGMDWWKMDLGSVYQINKMGVYGSNFRPPGYEFFDPIAIYSSTDDVDYTYRGEYGGSEAWGQVDFSGDINTRYIKLQIIYRLKKPEEMYQYEVNVMEIQAFQPGDATHISHAIDGGGDFWEWENFTDSKIVPANTSITYRYRTSTNGSDWTAWVNAIESVTSRVGEVKYRFIQVEASLTNSDGASTPILESYTIDYHTDVKPAAPTAQTAVIQ